MILRVARSGRGTPVGRLRRKLRLVYLSYTLIRLCFQASRQFLDNETILPVYDHLKLLVRCFRLKYSRSLLSIPRWRLSISLGSYVSKSLPRFLARAFTIRPGLAKPEPTESTPRLSTLMDQLDS
jgi:hypothetical protein